MPVGFISPTALLQRIGRLEQKEMEESDAFLRRQRFFLRSL